MEITNHKSEITNEPRSPWVGAVNIFKDKDGNMLLMKRSKQSKVYPGYWCLVGGFLNWGETGEEGAKREAKEEIGVEIEIKRFVGRFYNTSHPLKKNVISLPFYSKIISGTPHPAQPEECEDVKWFTPSEIRNMELAYDHKQILEDDGFI